MAITMAEHVDSNRVDAEHPDPGANRADGVPCDVLRGADGPVYFLLEGRLYVVHEIIDQWIEPSRVRPPGGRGQSPGQGRGRSVPAQGGSHPLTGHRPYTEHWLLVASVGRFGPPAIFRLMRSPSADGAPDVWTVRAERL
ncbi:MAG TPA: hypothetical protein VGM10_01375 [Actinocrinis sp.]|jgi:hypothetical protein